MFDVIIATYNRFEKANQLAFNLLSIGNEYIQQIIIIDSTDNQTIQNTNNSKIVHQLTHHKNQPLQRYLGFMQSSSPYILFLDDDMEIADNDCMSKLNIALQQNIVGIAIHFKDKHQDTSLNKIEKSAFANKSSSIRKFFNWFTAYPNLPEGVMGLCGVKGPQPQAGGSTTFVSGGAFAAKRKSLYVNFNFELFNLYETKIGKGEDAIIGYTLSRQGTLYYMPDLLFNHNDQKDSAYSIDQYSFAKRVTFSRLFLSLEKSRLDNKNKTFARIHFHWHTAWRIAGLSMNYLINKSNNRKQMLQGAIHGWQMAFKYIFKVVKYYTEA